MKVEYILKSQIAPFEINDEKIKKLFSYFLHLAPTIESTKKGEIPACGVEKVWRTFVSETGMVTKDYLFLFT